MLKPLYACAVAESILTRPRTKKGWSPKIGGNDLELAQWSSHLPVRNGTHAVLRTRTQTAMFTCGVALARVQVVTVSRLLNLVTITPSYTAIQYNEWPTSEALPPHLSTSPADLGGQIGHRCQIWLRPCTCGYIWKLTLLILYLKFRVV